ncbi:hypothetical protein KIPB_006188 [Kipferlia bialata]|uniref:Uncharacterized protein n=1 Tax=Kipferlia bialata TaxID=797122 RepID=A0A9K3CY51_9EUKA|nr:hypothetical protein KIPB_006188 [Kipferlia bialata]|eukprot:g6188.t1
MTTAIRVCLLVLLATIVYAEGAELVSTSTAYQGEIALSLYANASITDKAVAVIDTPDRDVYSVRCSGETVPQSSGGGVSIGYGACDDATSTLEYSWTAGVYDFEVTNAVPAEGYCMKVILHGPGSATCQYIAQASVTDGVYTPIVPIDMTKEESVTLDLSPYLFDREYMVYTLMPSDDSINRVTLDVSFSLWAGDSVSVVVGGCSASTVLGNELRYEIPTDHALTHVETYRARADKNECVSLLVSLGQVVQDGTDSSGRHLSISATEEHVFDSWWLVILAVLLLVAVGAGCCYYYIHQSKDTTRDTLLDKEGKTKEEGVSYGEEAV